MKKTEANVTSLLPDREERRSGAVFPSYYLAPISYYAQLLQCEAYSIDANEIYRKQTLHNRCYIASPNGLLSLTIPVVKFVPYHTPMRDIRISDHGNWRHLHWNALQSSYRRTPFFEFYADDFAPFYEKKWEFLVDYNQALQELVWEEVGGGGQGARSKGQEECIRQDNKQAANVSSCPLLLAPCSPPLTSCSLPLAPYYQLFSDRHGFMPDLSIVDLLFNMGPESLLYLNDLKVLKDPKALKDSKAPNPQPLANGNPHLR
ncbi:MAG: WbqC family protein [Bacteroidaceae bacterium]|nr:WbqC family protein [Bacteroidaceae bacterium]